MWSYQVIEVFPAHCFFQKLLPILDIDEKGNIKLFIIRAVRALQGLKIR
jgi:hypothetical protein